ncbi:putative Regulator of nonsense transcripts 2 [Monoraphidium neglectum]|uniref:Putative Regulator of nonsense transcripts 2 n=1 Tax=Monoraphidium neglectum TaxID=145388 RepID=A0A0D2KGG3_9CHLO|nr:putative Regulator of nonsense transcripts 2 [Monoraphidium neglectum]KIY94933.1 putative Regulator of nonsense transcripts 2 [Monoraphidium neglectum]|eukprot:XP_013893953.1 putative Regulator of nonsense transcripts 2 [Monoraphidium neglectum]
MYAVCAHAFACVLSAVEAEFDAQLAARKESVAAHEEPRLRTARYLAELSKFRLAAPSSALLRLKLLLDDFNGSNIDAACALVEGAGRFFMRLPESKVRMENLLAVMMRLRNARNLDSRHAAAVDAAYFACRPPDAAARRRRRPPLQEYIRHLIFERLGQGAIVDVLRKLMKLPWADCERYVLKCMLKVVRVRFSHISLIASLAGGLAQYHESLGVALVDCVLDDVRWGLDNPAAGNYQKRLAEMRLLGEMYNYMLMDSK